MVIIIATIVICVGMTLVYKCIWEPRYNFTRDTMFGVEYEEYKVETEAWYNTSASEYLRNKTTIAKPLPNRPDIKQLVDQNVRKPTTQG